jgi:molecular chaperone GrpE
MKTDEPKSGPQTEVAAPEPADAELVSLQEKLAKAESQRDDLLRTLADYENSRKRAARDLEIERKFAHLKLAGDLLPAFDNLDRALAAAKQVGEQGPLVQGVMATQAQVLDILKRHGITQMEVQGRPFDPNLHQAVQMMPSPNQPPNTVVQVLQQGFLIHDRVLRPATVVVSTGNAAK